MTLSESSRPGQENSRVPREGWGVLHLFCKTGAGFDHEEVKSAIKDATQDGYQVISFAVLGHKADLGFMVLGPDLWQLREFQRRIGSAGLVVVYSYFSMTEVSEYASKLSPERRAPRLYPTLPPQGKDTICFYPMSKVRGETHNWYALDFESRERLMAEHGASGRSFAGRVIQLVTGSSGIDDYEWGVTLFAERPDDLKDVVYTMRFDEASSRYAEFGPFYTGLIGSLDDVLNIVTT